MPLLECQKTVALCALIHLDTMPVLDRYGRTDGQTDRQTETVQEELLKAQTDRASEFTS